MPSRGATKVNQNKRSNAVRDARRAVQRALEMMRSYQEVDEGVDTITAQSMRPILAQTVRPGGIASRGLPSASAPATVAAAESSSAHGSQQTHSMQPQPHNRNQDPPSNTDDDMGLLQLLSDSLLEGGAMDATLQDDSQAWVGLQEVFSGASEAEGGPFTAAGDRASYSSSTAAVVSDGDVTSRERRERHERRGRHDVLRSIPGKTPAMSSMQRAATSGTAVGSAARGQTRSSSGSSCSETEESEAEVESTHEPVSSPTRAVSTALDGMQTARAQRASVRSLLTRLEEQAGRAALSCTATAAPGSLHATVLDHLMQRCRDWLHRDVAEAVRHDGKGQLEELQRASSGTLPHPASPVAAQALKETAIRHVPLWMLALGLAGVVAGTIWP